MTDDILTTLGPDDAMDLARTVALLEKAAPPYELPPGLEGKTFRAVERAIAEDRAAERRPARRWSMPRLPRLALAGGLAVALAAAVFAGVLLGGDDDPGLPGELELQASLTAASGQKASAEVRETGIGRVIAFDSSTLAILPKGEFYELWFVGPGDSATSPNRISAGTFHPDPAGKSQVRFAAAVDPAKYPRLAVTAEPGDGNPSPSGPDVLSSE